MLPNDDYLCLPLKVLPREMFCRNSFRHMPSLAKLVEGQLSHYDGTHQTEGGNVNKRNYFATSILFGIAPLVFAQVYKCQTLSGFEFSDAPCQNSKGNEIHVKPNVIDRSEGRIQNNHLKRQAEIREYSDDIESRIRYGNNIESTKISRQEAENLYKEATTKRFGESSRDFQTRSRAALRHLNSSGEGDNISKAERENVLRDAATKRFGESSRDFRTRSNASLNYLGAPSASSVDDDFMENGRPPVPRPVPSIITSCDKGGCWDNLGGRYNGSGINYVGPRGACQKIGNMMHCH